MDGGKARGGALNDHFWSEIREHTAFTGNLLSVPLAKLPWREEWRLNPKAEGSEEKELLSLLRNRQEREKTLLLPQDEAVK